MQTISSYPASREDCCGQPLASHCNHLTFLPSSLLPPPHRLVLALLACGKLSIPINASPPLTLPTGPFHGTSFISTLYPLTLVLGSLNQISHTDLKALIVASSERGEVKTNCVVAKGEEADVMDVVEVW